MKDPELPYHSVTVRKMNSRSSGKVQSASETSLGVLQKFAMTATSTIQYQDVLSTRIEDPLHDEP